MTHTRLGLVATIIAGIILVGFVISVPHTRDSADLLESTTEVIATVPEVTVRDVYRKGTHTITGSLQVPNPCSVIETQATLEGADSDTKSILVAITIPKDTGICLQEPVTLPFSVTIPAPTNLPIQVTVNGITATVTVL